ncbi:50S ribosomal protein L35Ae [Fonticula alba]|uniref:50S ribosomal protein L35Ae n=1 Tax=Fonticula alba TaxID=691883 RepID=A0A058Z8M7_FONAL|nr:50S ribosomal protein L35Ae [Fonticula alba]KCV70654.1 50S ribosomal protein L35Ae [Fonticula alba]|eukprot:XP_009495170.1 50S ribosomal protein L35Ae [Fonticula alba]
MTKLYSTGVFVGHTRSKRKLDQNFSLIKIDGVRSKEDTDFYLGKRVVLVYTSPKKVNGTTTKQVWGRIARSHGNSGVVRAKFAKNLPSNKLGAKVRVMLFPSRI